MSSVRFYIFSEVQAMKFINLTGQKFGKLTVKKCYRKNNITYCDCVCDCGNKKTTRSISLRCGDTNSCGCIRKEKAMLTAKHKKSNSRIYRSWANMKARCSNKNNSRYYCYGANGIKVCDEWLNDFQAFYEWSMSNGYTDELTIDRIDVNGNYEPSNCRWTTVKEQNNNTRRNRLITYNGKTQTLSQWAEELGIKYKTLQNRIDKCHWTVEKAFTTDIDVPKRNKRCKNGDDYAC